MYTIGMAGGRVFSRIRTPALVKAYLRGEAFPGAPEEDGTPGAQEAIDPGRGDYLASIHRHLKRRIKELSAEIAREKEEPYRYQYPRYHSFVTMMRHLLHLRLVERTGEVETSDLLVLYGDPPEGMSPDDLRLDPDRGFQQRHYYRLAPGAETDLAWDNPMAAIRAIYGIEVVARPRISRPAPVEEEAPERPPRQPRRPRRRGVAEEAPAAVSEELQELHRQLDLRRQGLQEQARYAAQSGGDVGLFEVLEQDIGDFIDLVRPYYRRHPLSILLQDLGTLTGCSQAFARAASSARRHEALEACRRASAVLAVDLATPLPVPDLYPGPLPVPVEEPQQEEIQEEEEPPGITQEAIDQITLRWKALEDRINGWARPNSTNAVNLLDRFAQELVEAFPDIEILEDALDSAISDVRQALEAYQEAEPENREAAWEEFKDSFTEVDFSELGQV